MHTPKHSFTEGLRDGLPIFLGYVSVAFAFGISATGQGLTVWQVVLISMTNVTSAGQLAGVPLIAASAPLTEIGLTQLIINLRYALMSVSLSQKLDPDVRLGDRFAISFVNTDEVFAVASGKEGKVGRAYLYGLILPPYVGWAVGTLVGAVAGNILPAFLISALGIAIYGMFIAIIVPPSRTNHAVLGAVLTAAGLSCLIYYTPLPISSGFSIILCTVVTSVILALIKPLPEEDETHA